MKDKQLRKEFEELKEMVLGKEPCVKSNVIGFKMFGFKIFEGRKGSIQLLQEITQNLTKILEQIHPCSTCKALFRVEDLQRVELKGDKRTEMKDANGIKFYVSFGEKEDKTLFYCPSHKVPYDRIQDGKYYKDNVEIGKENIDLTKIHPCPYKNDDCKKCKVKLPKNFGKMKGEY